MSWRAVFVDGPLAGVEHDRTFMGSWQSDLYFTYLTPVGWVMVGMAGMIPDPPWPGQVHYRRNDESSSLIRDEHWQPGEDEGFAIYELA